jgi:putative ABC transport system substrate-binding protein
MTVAVDSRTCRRERSIDCRAPASPSIAREQSAGAAAIHCAEATRVRRRALLAGGVAAALAARTTHAQAPANLVRLGYLWIGAPGSDGLTLSGLRQGLADVGLVEGRNLRIEARYADSHPERLRALAEELVRLNVAVLLVPGTAATSAARAATTTIPIVSASGNPVSSGFAESLARPGRNVTGLTLQAGSGLPGKWLELLKEVVPALARVAVLLNPASGPVIAEVAPRSGAAMGIDVVLVRASDAATLVAALAEIGQAAVGGIVVSADPLLNALRAPIVAFAAERRLPAVYGLRDFVEAGGLMSYAANIFDVWRRAGTYVERILAGARPGDLPIEQPRTFELLINLSAARAIGLTVPPTVLARADQVIE